MNVAPSTTAKFGQSVKRVEDSRLITGNGRYVDDLLLPGQTYAAFVRSAHAHARIASIDTSSAAQMPGVVRILTGQDLVDAGLAPLPCGWNLDSVDGTPARVAVHRALATDAVRFVGEPVALVIAETRNQARDAADAVFVNYEELPTVVDLRAAIAPDAPQLHADIPQNRAFTWGIGDAAQVDAAFARASHKVGIELRNNRLVPNAMEPRAINAEWRTFDRSMTIHLTHQNPIGMRVMFMMLLGLESENHLRVVSPDVGGGFGSKAPAYPEELAVAFAARAVGRPVKWTAERTESFLTDAHGRDHITTAELALDDQGHFLAIRVHTLANFGAYVSTSNALVVSYMYATMLTGQYNIPAAHALVEGIYTNTCPVDAYRGAGRPEAAYLIERLANLAAQEIGVDQAEIRRRNFIRTFPHQTPLVYCYDSGDYEGCLDAALRLADYAGFESRRAEARARGKLRGIGLSAYVEACGIGPSRLLASLGGAGSMWESCEIRVQPAGSVEVLTGAHNHGQGHQTVYAQLVSERFGIPMDRITVIQGDTDRIQAGTGTYGSRASVGLSAAARSCDKIISKGREIVACMLGVEPDQVDFEDGIYSSAATNQTVAFAEMAHAAHAAASFPTDRIEPGLVATTFFDPPNFTYPAGVHVCEVEIDPETGVTEVVAFNAADDFGTVANPMIVEGQVHGGVTQGIGQALWENAVYDPETAQLLTASYMDYGMPRADSLPEFGLTFWPSPTPVNPLGMKGCGEAGAIGSPPAVINAVCDALGIAHMDMPASPEKIWRICRQRSEMA
ncbi:xanthine dehydrogenase family protein molybdopterin-binding subunit [Novosphingobium sp. ERN07]|uniref:xanthine dehydrogenase family protein molybdopterin-binding subunit n=1 Tax=unclassified Novosphingobium TaxID=2644732 RepID=UPI001456C74A|nr:MULTISPECIES: xanthine dehydrogenase family protein molybdopterin-binding subunit [unclassified Novosphingobium]NLR41634.1 xanthine dehydrogenase family protein molybdopterin-binding subunit [Novosphingobium sp. ERW19]NLR73274.1 xanthine dehydrogenase family protein molybdopterin-binding subunit [Novosphingobium sp. ERN07]